MVNIVNHWGYFIYLSWMPSYFHQALGLDLRASSFLAFLPWAVRGGGARPAQAAPRQGSQRTRPAHMPPLGPPAPAMPACRNAGEAQTRCAALPRVVLFGVGAVV